MPVAAEVEQGEPLLQLLVPQKKGESGIVPHGT